MPVEAWEYNSPLVKAGGKTSDVGLLAEALVYYDQVRLDLPTGQCLVEFIEWAIERSHINNVLNLIESGALSFHHYAFLTSAVNVGNIYVMANIQEEARDAEYYVDRLLRDVRLPMLHARKSKALLKWVRSSIELSFAEPYEKAIEAARLASSDPMRAASVVQTVLDDVYVNLFHETPPEVECQIEHVSPESWRILYNVDLAQIRARTGGQLDLRPDMPLIGEAHVNRTIWTAALTGSDLYLGSVMSDLTLAKLAEAGTRAGKPQDIIRELEIQVGFPDIRHAVNGRRMDLEDVLAARKEAETFREWLRSISDTDQNIAQQYYNQEFKPAVVSRGQATTLKVIGALAAGGAFLSGGVDAQAAAHTLGAAGSALSFLNLVADRYTGDWKPMVFGKWLDRRISRRQV